LTFKTALLLLRNLLDLSEHALKVEIQMLTALLTDDLDGCPKMERYKLAVQVIVGENKGQGIRVTSKCMWDPNIDNHASYTFVNVNIKREFEIIY